MLTGFTWCIPLKSKKAAEVSRAYLQHIYSVLVGSTKILTDNGTEFKNEVFKEMLQKLGTEKLIHSPPYRPQSNGRIEGFHRYLKACMAKYMRAGLEWDEVTAMATAAYNYFQNMSAKESAFFLMYGRDPLNKLSAILNAPRRYLGDATGFPDLEALKNMYQMVAQQLINSRERYVKSNRYNKVPDHGILVGDLVLVKDHTAKSFEPKYKEDFRVVQVYGTNALQVSDKRGKLHNVHITDVRKINMTEKIAAQLQEAYNNKGRTAKHLIPQGRIPDLGWNTDQQGKERQKLPNTTPEAPVTQTMPQQAEGPPSSRLRSKSKTTTLIDPQNHNAKMIDQHNALPQVNQVHTVRKAGFGWQTVVALTIIVNFNNNIVLMFQNVSVTKSAPFALLTIYQKSLYPPKVFLNCPHFGKLHEICRPFFDLNNEKWNPPISQQIARKSLNLPPPTMNHAKSAQFLLNPTNPCSPTVPQPFYSKSRKIRSIRKYSGRMTRN